MGFFSRISRWMRGVPGSFDPGGTQGTLPELGEAPAKEDRGDPQQKRRLDFGPWEKIFYGEFDGMRRKRVLVKVIGE
jgi:hypothetical protein